MIWVHQLPDLPMISQFFDVLELHFIKELMDTYADIVKRKTCQQSLDKMQDI